VALVPLYFVVVTIHELTGPECVEVLQRAHVGRLACARDGQPYIVPISFYFDKYDQALYSFSTVGQKIHWMRDNPRVCVETDDVADRFNWVTVVITGLYDELRDASEAARAKRRALKLFEEQPEFWLPGAAKLSSGVEHSAVVVYRIQVVTMSGRRAARGRSQP
jgi:nitroimidazol reductase NimA-like FMN-containing flavoprotein (pyridoxamine 5'-phosphate oxidase superfamily)